MTAIHSIVCETAIYVSGLVGGQPVDMLIDTQSVVTLVSANGQPLDTKGKCELHICVDGVFAWC